MLSESIKEEIRAGGPISVARFMERALYDPEAGYYLTKEPFGTTGDFTTAPEISQLFGEMLGVWVADCWLKTGCRKLRLVECGPGRGTLMEDLLRATRKLPDFHASLEVVLVEISPRLAALQRQKLTAYPFVTQATTLAEIPATLPTLLLGNEFLDALPIQQFCGVKERLITLNTHGDFTFTEEGPVRETCPLLPELFRQVARLCLPQGGACLFIDYGYSGTTPIRGTLQAVQKHRHHPIFSDIGKADITALVAFSEAAEQAKAAGLQPLGLRSQREFLLEMGIAHRLPALLKQADAAKGQELEHGMERLLSETQMGNLFKVFCATSPGFPTPHGF